MAIPACAFQSVFTFDSLANTLILIIILSMFFTLNRYALQLNMHQSQRAIA